MKVNKRLYLIGTVHNDFKGYDRLTKIFEGIGPDAIGIETDDKGWDYFASGKYKERMCIPGTSNIQSFYKSLEGIRKKNFEYQMFEMPKLWMYFEMRAAQDYANKHGTKLFMMDSDRGNASIENNDIFGEVSFSDPEFRKKALDLLLMEPKVLIDISQRGTDARYENITELGDYLIRSRHAIKMGLLPEDISKDHKERILNIHDEEREVVMEKHVRAMRETNIKIIAVMGQGHVSLMYDRLRDLCPVAMTLLGKRYTF